MGKPRVIKVHGIDLKCRHCGHGRFIQRSAHLNTPLMTFFDLDFLNRTADIFICEECGFLHWFLNPSKTSAEGQENGEEVTICVECGETLLADARKCPRCGWTYKAEL